MRRSQDRRPQDGRRGRTLGAAGAALALAAALAGCGPIGPFSGGELSGRPSNGAVSDWSFTDEHDTVQVETRGTEPHSVNTWCAALGGRLYVPTSMIRGPKSPAEREWVRNVQQNPNVRLRVGDTLYELTAVRVADPAELEAARARLEAKYGLDPAERDPEREIWIFRLEARS